LLRYLYLLNVIAKQTVENKRLIRAIFSRLEDSIRLIRIKPNLFPDMVKAGDIDIACETCSNKRIELSGSGAWVPIRNVNYIFSFPS
jgi:hypothetical protein